MSDKLTALRIKQQDGTYSAQIPVGALAENIAYNNDYDLKTVLGNVNMANGNLQSQIDTKVGPEYVEGQISEDVSNWLDTNVNPVGSAVVVDKTLAIDGAAADAKKTGEIKSAVDYFENGYRQIYGYNIIPNEYPKSDGTFESYSNWQRTDYIEITGGHYVYFVSEYTSSDNAWYDENKQIISTFSIAAGNPVAVFAPGKAKYMIVSTRPARWWSAIYTTQSSYVEPADTTLYDKSRNKFNPESSLISTGGYWTESGKNSSSSARVTHPIYVLAGIEYKATHPTSYLGSNNNIAIVNGSGSELANRLGDFKGVVSNGTIVFTPTFSGFVSLNIGNLSDDNFIVAETGEFPNNGQSYSPDYMQERNPLIGKKLSVNGDSICAGAGFAGGYAGIIGKRNNMTVQNIAVNGATITSGTTSGGSNRHWISTSIADMDTDADYIILEGGVNDDETVIGANKIGTINPIDYTGPFDTTTFCGALDYMFQQAYERFPGKKIGFIIVHKVVQMFNSSTEYANNRYPYVVKACKKWGIPYIDLNSTTAPLGYIASLKSAYTNNNDGWHPNEAGYKAYYVPQIEAWMKTL